MAGVKGRSGTNKNKEKPFAEALRMEIAAAGDNHKALRGIARNLLELAQQPNKDALPAIQQIADRLDGKPMQEATLTADVSEEFAKLWGFISEAGNTELGDGVAEEPGQPPPIRH